MAHDGIGVLQILIRVSPRIPTLVVVRAESLVSAVGFEACDALVPRHKGEDEHDSVGVWIVWIAVGGAAMPNVLVEHHGIALEHHSAIFAIIICWSGKSIGAGLERTVVQTHLLHIGIRTMMRPRAKRRRPHPCRGVLERYEHGVAVQKCPGVQQTAAKVVGIGVDILIARSGQAGHGGYFHNCWIQTQYALKRRFNRGVGSHLAQCLGDDGMVAGPEAEGEAIVLLEELLVPRQLRLNLVSGFQIRAELGGRRGFQYSRNDDGAMTHHGRCGLGSGDGVRINVQIVGIAGRNVGSVALPIVVRRVVDEVIVKTGGLVGLGAAVRVDVRDDVGLVGVANQDGRDH